MKPTILAVRNLSLCVEALNQINQQLMSPFVSDRVATKRSGDSILPPGLHVATINGLPLHGSFGECFIKAEAGIRAWQQIPVLFCLGFSQRSEYLNAE